MDNFTLYQTAQLWLSKTVFVAANYTFGKIKGSRNNSHHKT